MAQAQKPIRAMHEKIICRKRVLQPVAAGEFHQSWADIATLWADVVAKDQSPETTARQNHLAATYLVRVRYQEALFATRNILWQGRDYRVVSLLNPDNRKRILEFVIVEDQP